MAGSPNFIASIVERVKRSAVNRVIALVAVLLLGGASYGVKLILGGQKAAPQTATVSAPAVQAPQTPAAAPAAAQASAAPAVTVVQPASAGNSGAAVVTSVTSAPVQPELAQRHMEDHLTYQYNALGRRDPFQSLVGGDFVGVDVGGDAPPDPGGIKVVGIVWGSTDQFALVEDVRGNSLVLRRGDKVQNGYVQALKRDAVIFSLTAEGQTQSVVIPLIRKGDQNAR